MAETVFEVRGDGEIRKFNGNWTDWQTKRKEENVTVRAEKSKNTVSERPKGGKIRFSYKEEREFATIDQDIAVLEEKITVCEAEQEKCGSDYIKLQELQAQQSELERQLEEKMERWVYLNELKEKIDAQ